MKFGCPEPSKIMFDVWNFVVVLGAFHPVCVKFFSAQSYVIRKYVTGKGKCPSPPVLIGLSGVTAAPENFF